MFNLNLSSGPTNGLTIIARLDTTQSGGKLQSILTINDGKNGDSDIAFALLRDYLGFWYIAKRVDGPLDMALVMHASRQWDPPRSPCTAANSCTFDTVYITFATNGPVYIDEYATLAHPAPGQSKYIWFEGAANAGYPLQSYRSGNGLADPTGPLDFLPAQGVYVGGISANWFAAVGDGSAVYGPAVGGIVANPGAFADTSLNGARAAGTALSGMAYTQGGVLGSGTLADLRNAIVIDQLSYQGTADPIIANGTQPCNAGLFENTTSGLTQESYTPLTTPSPCRIGQAVGRGAISPSYKIFGSTTNTYTFTVSNQGQNGSVLGVSGVTIEQVDTGDSPSLGNYFSVVQGGGQDCLVKSALSQGASCTVTVQFAPDPNDPGTGVYKNFRLRVSTNSDALVQPLIAPLYGGGGIPSQGPVDPHCRPGVGQYPGCDSDGSTVYTLCSAENATCTFPGQRVVQFGANGGYKSVTVNNAIACTAAALGVPDPIPGVAKACYYGPAIWDPGPPFNPQGVYCADENGVCNFNGSANAVLALGYQSTSRPVQSSFNCTVAAFGGDQNDPHMGLTKTCFYQLPNNMSGAPTGNYVLCAAENQTCSFAGAAKIAFGVNGKFSYRTFPEGSPESSAGGVACSTSAFPDPADGVVKACYYQYATFVSSSAASTGNGVGIVGGNGTAPGSGTGGASSPCDIYASGGTPCVAAHSTVRALFGGYGGRLYQVKRASDNTTMDIGTLATGGYANAAAQDSFCASTACIITMIYDQTSLHNDLAIAGPGGGAVSSADSGAVANALPIVINGNKVYGVQVTSGVGYRNNATSGIATKQSPEGIYMVTSGTFVNGGPGSVNNGCCFDYGNAETSAQDTGEGHMDALNFTKFCEFTCTGSGPWVEVDLENGQYMGNGTNLADVSMPYDFVTAMVKNNGKDTFALKGGNAQSGGLIAEYSGSLPTTKPGYIPMNLEGAIILGTGGDNSDWGIGEFFEGAMTSGYPTDAAETAVQANIVAAGYACGNGGCSSGSGGTSVIEPAGTYTGPSDPDGPGPQDGFASPAAEQPNDIMATKPALASFNGNLYVAFQGANVENDLYVTSSPSGNNFPTATRYTNIQSSSAPALAAFNNQLFMAFRGLNVDNDFYITSSPDGTNFPTATRYTNIQMGGAPALAVFNNQLFAAFQANDSSHNLFVTASSDGVTWPTAWQIPNVKIGSDPALAVFNGLLYVAFRADDPGNDVWIASSPDGVNFTSQKLLPQTMDGYSSPALVASNGVLYYIYEANDQGHEMLVTATTDGSTWQGPAAYLNVQMGRTGPGAAAFGNGVSVGFQSNDSRNVLFVTGKVTEASTYTGPTDAGNGGAQDTFTAPAAQQTNDIMGSKPALAAFKGSVFAAFEGVGQNNDLYVTSSPTGSNFPTATQYTNLRSSSAPAMAQFNNQLFIAFRGLNVNNALQVTSSPTGTNFPTATGYNNIELGGAPAMTLFNNRLYIAFQANDANHHLFVTSSADGYTWPDATYIPNVQTGGDPAMAVLNGILYIAFRANDTSNNVFITSSADGVNFTSQQLAGQTMAWGSSPGLAVINQNGNNVLYYFYEANDSAHELLVTSSSNGTTWPSPALYSNITVGATGPAATGFGNTVYAGFQSNDSRNVLFVTSQPVNGGNSHGLYIPNSTYYPRLVRLSHGSSATNGHIVASTNGNISVSTDGGIEWTFTGTVPSQIGSQWGGGTLYEMPQTVGSLQAGTLLFASTYYTGSPTIPVIEIYTSTDQGNTWNYLSTPVTGLGILGNGVWEPQFEVANDGALVMFWSNETDSCCSQKLSHIRTYNGTTWQDASNVVASSIQADRPGMAVVSKMPNGTYFMSYELCGPASCTAFSRTSTDGWNFGDPSDTGTKVQTPAGQYFEHAPNNVWSPSVLASNGALLLIGQQLFESNGSVSNANGLVMFANLTNGVGPWYMVASPVPVPNAYNNYCPNYSSAILPSADGSGILVLASTYNNNNQCVSYLGAESWNQLPTDGTYYAFQNVAAGLCLDDYKGGTANRTPADLSGCTDSNGVYDEYWQVHSQGNGYFTIQSNNTGLCVDNTGGVSTPGNPVVLWTCNAGDPNQNWRFIDVGMNQYELQNQAADEPLDDTGGSTTPGTQLEIWTDLGFSTQHWVLH